jgi:hypothetical protein
MRRRAFVIAAAVALASAAALAAGCDMPSTGGLGQVGGSGNIVTRHYDFTGFTKVVVDSGFDVEIDYAKSHGVQVRVDDNLVGEHLKVELDGDTLHIGLAALWRYHDVTTTARVEMPRITGLETSGASRVWLSGFASGAPLQLEASGSSRVETAGSSFGKVTTDVSGASRVEGDARMDGLAGEVSGGSALQLHGSAALLALDASGGSDLDLMELTVEDADLTLSGGSHGQVTVTGSLRVEASGGSRLEYAGDPQLDAHASGGSDVKPH